MQEKRQKILPCDRDCSLSVETLARFTKARRWNDFLECPSGTARSKAFVRANHFNASPKRYWHQITPETLIENASRYGNFSQPIYNVSNASVPTERVVQGKSW